MRVTITPAGRPASAFTLVDGAGPSTWPLRGEVFGLAAGGLDGWKNGVAPRYEAPEIPGQHGSYPPDEVVLASRLLTVRGFYAAAPTASSLGAARFEDLLASLIGEWLIVTVHDAAGVREVQGFISAIPVNERLSERRLRFTLIILCPDPLKYGPEVLFPVPTSSVTVTEASVTVSNAGTGAVFPRIVASGRVTTIDIRCQGRRVRWVGDADGLSLDFVDGLPLSDGVEEGTLVFGEVFRIPPGTTEVGVVTDGAVQIGVAPGWK